MPASGRGGIIASLTGIRPPHAAAIRARPGLDAARAKALHFQGQVTAFTDVLKGAGVAISMDGKGRWVDNVFVERLWRSVKYEEVYLHAYEGVAAARAGLGRYFRFYNAERRHQGLGRRTPDAVYADSDSWLKAA